MKTCPEANINSDSNPLIGKLRLKFLKKVKQKRKVNYYLQQTNSEKRKPQIQQFLISKFINNDKYMDVEVEIK